MNNEISFSSHNKIDIKFICILMSYFMCVILSIVVFQEIFSVNLFGQVFNIPGALLPYVFLYPIAYIVLKVYGYPTVSRMIIATLIMSLVFVIFCNIVVNLPSSVASKNIDDNLKSILDASLRLYAAGLIAMPAGAYASLFTIRWLKKYTKNDYYLYIISTLFGEFVNTVLVFVIGFGGQYTLDYIISNIVSVAYGFKVITGIVLSPLAVYGVKYLEKKAKRE